MNTKKAKKGIFGRVGVLALALTLVSSSMVFSTLAKYTTEVTVAGSAEVAKWNIDFKGNADGATEGAFTTGKEIKLTDTSLNSKVTNGKIAPGTAGQFTVKVNGNDSDVGYEYSVTIQNIKNMPTNMKFYTDAAHSQQVTEVGGKIVLTDKAKVALANPHVEQTQTYYWEWAFDGDAAADVADTKNGVAALGTTFDLVLNATQLDPSKV